MHVSTGGRPVEHTTIIGKHVYTLNDGGQCLQGVIVAAPVYAATGSRWKAMGIATASVSPAGLMLQFMQFAV